MKMLIYSLKEKKYLVQAIIYLILFIAMFFVIDNLNTSYKEMINDYGLYLVILNAFLNIVMAVLSSLLMISSELIVKGFKSSGMGFLAIIFAMFTYGCAPCLIAFFANFGIIISVIALPLAGLPYKLISLALIVLGLFISIYQMNRGCKVKIKKEE